MNHENNVRILDWNKNDISRKEEDTVQDLTTNNVSLISKIQFDEFPEAARVVVVDCFGISKRF